MASYNIDDVIIVEEVPVFNLNFYLMGMDEVNEEITLQIGENVEYLNQEFEGRIKFKLNRLFMDANHAYLPDLHADFVQRETTTVEELVNPIEVKGGINIFLFETYAKVGTDAAMTGFTPVLRARQTTYESNSPRFDRLFIAYPGLIDKTTIVHEMGHFLGLSHPWELNTMSKSMMGLDDASAAAINHMSYNFEVEEFTTAQLDRMHHYALNFRRYLLDEIQITY